jgi:hypothetical protein
VEGDSTLDGVLAKMLDRVLPHLGERQRRLVCGALAGALGHGGVTRVAELAGLSIPTVLRGGSELDDPPDPYGRTRREGGGPTPLVERQPGLLQALDQLVDPDTRGDPESPLRWTTKSTRHLAEALGAQGFQVSDDTIGRLLKQQGYRLQRTRKTLEGAQHPDRDAQFGYLNEQAREHLAPASRSSRSIPRRRNWSATTPMGGRVAAVRRAGRGRGVRLPRSQGRQGDPVWDL